jgi:hypothetical protein
VVPVSLVVDCADELLIFVLRFDELVVSLELVAFGGGVVAGVDGVVPLFSAIVPVVP